MKITEKIEVYVVGIYERANPKNNDITVVKNFDDTVNLCIRIGFDEKVSYNDDAKHIHSIATHEVGAIYETSDCVREESTEDVIITGDLLTTLNVPVVHDLRQGSVEVGLAYRIAHSVFLIPRSDDRFYFDFMGGNTEVRTLTELQDLLKALKVSRSCSIVQRIMNY